MKKLLSKHLTRSVFFLFLALGAVSCSNDDDDPTPSSPTGVEGSWNITALTVAPAYDGISDILAAFIALAGNDCIKRITFIFKGDGTIDGTVPADCTSDDDDIVPGSGKWKVVGDKIQLTDDDGSVEEYDLSVNATEMKWSYDEVEAGVSYKYTITFKRK